MAAGDSDDDNDESRVHLRLPAGGPAAALARAAALNLGRQAGFGRAALGSLTLAVDEALVLVLPSTRHGVDLDTAIVGEALTITVRSRQPHTALDPAAAARFDEVARGLVTTATVDLDEGVVRLDCHPAAKP